MVTNMGSNGEKTIYHNYMPHDMPYCSIVSLEPRTPETPNFWNVLCNRAPTPKPTLPPHTHPHPTHTSTPTPKELYLIDYFSIVIVYKFYGHIWISNYNNI